MKISIPSDKEFKEPAVLFGWWNVFEIERVDHLKIKSLA